MAGIPFISKILALAGIGVKNQTDNKEVLINVSPAQAAGSTVTVDLPASSGQLALVSEVVLQTEKAAANGVATLDSSGKIPSSQLPPITITNTYVVSSQAAMLALSANVGDVAVRTDINETFILQSLPASTLSNWIELLEKSGIQSVNGQTNPDVVLTATNVGALPITGGTLTGLLTIEQVGSGAGEAGRIALRELTANGSYTVSLRAPDSLADYVTLTLPESHGSAGQVLSTDGSGVLSWVAATPSGVVTEVNGYPGPIVTLNAADVGAVAKAGDTMTGALVMGPTGVLSGQAGKISFRELAANGTHSVSLVAPDSISSSISFTLPASDGSAGQVLSTNGSGVLSFVAIPSAPVSSVNGRTGAVTVGEIVHPTTGSTFEYQTANAGMTGQYNTAYGVQSLISQTTGTYNTAIGYQAFKLGTAGNYNTVIGSQALAQLANASSQNTVIGSGALFDYFGNGGSNVAIGASAGRFLNFGAYNTFINSEAGFSTLNGVVSIGVDSSGASSAASADNQFVLGTSLHKYRLPGVVQTALVLGPTSTSAGSGGVIQFRELAANGSHYVAFKAADSITANVTWTLPAADGSSGQILSTDGAGNLSWTAAIPSGVVTSVNGYTGPAVTLNATDVGAVAKTGDTMTGGLTVSPTSSTVTIALSQYGIAYQHTGDGYRASISQYGLDWSKIVTSVPFPVGTGFGAQYDATNYGGAYARVYDDSTGGRQIAITTSELRFYESNSNGSNYVGFKGASSLTSNVIFTLPTADGTSGQVLSTDGLGNLSWSAAIPAGVVTSVNGQSGPTVSITPENLGVVKIAGDTMTGALVMGPTGTLSGQTGVIRFSELASNGSDTISLRAPDSLASSVTLTLPNSAGSAGQVLATNGSGALSWVNATDTALTARVEKLELSRGVYTGTLNSNQELDISSLVDVGGIEYPIVQIYKVSGGVSLQVNVEFSWDATNKKIVFGEVVDGPINAVIHVLALTSPLTTL